jgi:hypothetical protein
VSGQTIEVTGVTLAGGSSLTVTYGARFEAAPTAAVASQAGTSSFAVSERSSAAGTQTPLAKSASLTATTIRPISPPISIPSS